MEQQKIAKLTEFHKFQYAGHTIDKGRHRNPILQAIYNKGPQYISLMKPVVMYCDERSRFLSWLSADQLETITQAYVPVKDSGAFVKSIGFENFEMSSEMSKLMKCHSIYAVACSDKYIHVYTQQSNIIRYYGAFYSGRVC